MNTVKEYLAKIGKKGGKARVANMSKEELKAANRRAAEARWAKVKKADK